jgi:RHS repeat-associated protein
LFSRFFLATLLFFQFSAALANLGFTPKSIATQAINTSASADITTYGPADNLLRVFEDKRYFYDGHGRLLVKKSGRHQTQYFEWDDSHQLQAVHTVREDADKATKTVASTRFTYDPLGRRTSKTHHDGQQASTTRFAWDGLKLLSETRQTVLGATSQGETLGDKTSLYIYADTGSYEPLARVDTLALKTAKNDAHFSIASQTINTPAGEEISLKSPSKSAKIFYFHNDLNGLPQELSQDGQFVWRASYKVWGNVVSEEWTGSYAKANAKAQPETQNLRFQGQYYDVETGLHYNTFRFYDPDIGRFTSPDPIGLEGGDNLYAYAPNPIAWVDPWGLAGVDIYRGMTPEGSQPQVGETARTLGVRPGVDIPVDANGRVHPNTGGMSVSPAIEDLPSHRRPPEHGGTGKDPVWKLNTSNLGDDLAHVPDKPGHGTIQPSKSMPLSRFQTALANLKSGWAKC